VRLVVIGDGPEMAKIRGRAPRNVTLLGHQPFDALRDHVRRARAFLFAAVEDFGIAPLEAQAVGTPVIALAAGALPETVPGLEAERPCGVHFAEQTPEAVRDAVERFERLDPPIRASDCRRNAERFAVGRFRAEFRAVVDEALAGRPAVVI
jgi:glycosyltransferase involved in cell wall biosynthesis